MATAETAQDAWAKLVNKKDARDPAFAYVEPDQQLPNVLIYGDSISIGYTPQVRQVLKGKANVFRLHANGSDSGVFIELMKQMHSVMQDSKLDNPWKHQWDVIHFNVGLHDLKYLDGKRLDKENGKQVNSTETYGKNLKTIIAYLKEIAPQAKLVFCTTTPVPEDTPGRVAGDAAKYNEVALNVMKNHPEILINDLYSFTKPNQQKWYIKPGNVHFNGRAKAAQGDEVARVILQALNP